MSRPIEGRTPIGGRRGGELCGGWRRTGDMTHRNERRGEVVAA